MMTDRVEAGMLAKSKAGHDKGHIYVICEVDETYVYLADGKKRTLTNQKKKKKKHVQVICEQYNISDKDDVEIKRILKLFDKE